MTGIPAVPLTPATAADQPSRPLLVMAHPRHGQDSRGNCDDAETQEHHDRGQQSPQFRLGNDVAEPTVVIVTIAQ